ncbi:MAG: nucleotidyltransferase family protein [Holophagaceae bacterium]|nr:nucleotidyltransferase family protein [Holophagaceae bacterium]
MSIAAVILAAGASRRMGRPKQLLELDGESLVHRAARIALQAGCDPAIVVLGHHAEAVGAALSGLPCAKTINMDWAEGMASSIRTGIAAVPQHATAALLLACDQPAVDADFLRTLIKEYRLEPERIAAASYAGAVGIPALFPRRCFEALKGLAGDRGARALLEDADVLSLPLLGGEMDIDTIIDYEAMQRRMEQS